MTKRESRVIRISLIVFGVLVFLASVIGALYVTFTPYKRFLVSSAETYSTEVTSDKIILVYDMGLEDMLGKKEYSNDREELNYTVVEYTNIKRIGRVYHKTTEKELVYLPKGMNVKAGTEICCNTNTHEYVNAKSVVIFPAWLVNICEIYCCMLLAVVLLFILALFSVVTGIDVTYRRRYRG